jgi:serine acetyltransferase
MMRRLKDLIWAIWLIDRIIRFHIRVWRRVYRVPVVGPPLSLIADRLLLMAYGIDLRSEAIDVHALTIAHPGGVLLGGNGLYSAGRVAIMAGVKLVGRSPNDPEYLRRHKLRRVFTFGDNVVIGANSVVIGPVDICDNVLVGAMSLVNASIVEPGVYVGIPARRIEGAVVSDEWVAHLPLA